MSLQQCGFKGCHYSHVEGNTQKRVVRTTPNAPSSFLWLLDCREQTSSEDNSRRNEIPSKEQDARTKLLLPKGTIQLFTPDHLTKHLRPPLIGQFGKYYQVALLRARIAASRQKNPRKALLKNTMSTPRRSVVKTTLVPNQPRYPPYNSNIGYGVADQLGITHYPASPIAQTRPPVSPRRDYWS